MDYGFRLPSAYDNRPLLFDEFRARQNQTIYVSATPAAYELGLSENTVEQIIRPTGLIDPLIVLRPATGQVDDLVGEIHRTTEKGGRVLVTTLTKRMAESLTDYLKNLGIRVRYLHSDIQTMERTQLIRDLRLGEFDVLVGINLLREGLDMPEVSLVAILDADKEGFLRSETSLIQTIGRAARNVDGRVILYGDVLTESMERAMNETNRRRALQEAYNKLHGITPQSVRSTVQALIRITDSMKDHKPDDMSDEELQELMKSVEDQMLSAAKNLDFERAAKLRDETVPLKGRKARRDSKAAGAQAPAAQAHALALLGNAPVKQVLLEDARMRPVGGKGRPAAVILVDHAANPHVYRCGGEAVIAKEHHAAGHLYPNAMDGLQLLQQRIVGQSGHGGQIGPPVRHAARRVQQIGRPVSRPAGAQAPFARPKQILRAGKGKVPPPSPAHFGSAARAQRLHAGADGGNALPLGNQKAHQRLPRVLPEDAQAPGTRRPQRASGASRSAASRWMAS